MKDAVMEPETEQVSDIFAADAKAQEPQVYEVGYHVLPTASEAEAAKEHETLAALLKKLGAEPVMDKAPVRMDLAYVMEKKIGGQIRRFSSSYFGWNAFELPPAKIGEVKVVLDGDENILRFLIIKTSRDAVALATAEPAVELSTKVLREAEAGGEVSEAALDTVLKQIESDDTKAEDTSTGSVQGK